MAGCRRAREEQPCGPCRGALAFGFSHPGAASAPACPQTDSLDASHRMAPPPRRHLLTSWSLRFGWLRAAAWSPNATARLFAWLPPATALPPLDANKRMLEWMPGTKGWEQAQREQMPPSQTGADDADAAARGSSGARGDKRKREVTDGGRAPAVPFACLDASSPTPTRRATTPCANCQSSCPASVGRNRGGGWLAVAGGACVHPYPCATTTASYGTRLAPLAPTGYGVPFSPLVLLHVLATTSPCPLVLHPFLLLLLLILCIWLDPCVCVSYQLVPSDWHFLSTLMIYCY